MFHTIERENDAFLDLGEAKILEDVEAAIFDCSPDFVVLDPLNTFTSGDLNSDRDCRAVLTAISQAVGWDRGSYEPQLEGPSCLGAESVEPRPCGSRR